MTLDKVLLMCWSPTHSESDLQTLDLQHAQLINKRNSNPTLKMSTVSQKKRSWEPASSQTLQVCVKSQKMQSKAICSSHKYQKNCFDQSIY